MDTLENRIESARQNETELDKLVRDYLPFIKKQVSRQPAVLLEYEDMLSISMLVFVNCVYQYEKVRGGFLAFAGRCIRNRLIDESRRAGKQAAVIRLEPEEEPVMEERASYLEYDKGREQERLREEIDALEQCLEGYRISFFELPESCPKQERARMLCMSAASCIIKEPGIRDRVLSTQKLPQAELAAELGISVKTLEKHRKYIVTLVVILTGDYPCIRAYLPQQDSNGRGGSEA